MGGNAEADVPVPEPFFDDAPDPFAPPPGPPAAPPSADRPPSPPPPPGAAGWYPPAGPYPYQPYPAPASTNGFAIAALVCGIAGLFTDGVAGVFGVIFGIVALRQIRRDGQGGQALAIAGIVVGTVTAMLGVALLVFWLAGPASNAFQIPT